MESVNDFPEETVDLIRTRFKESHASIPPGDQSSKIIASKKHFIARHTAAHGQER